VQGAGFRVQGAGFRVQGSGCRVQLRVWGFPTVNSVNRGCTFASRRSNFDFCLGGQRSSGFRVRVDGLGFRVQG